MKSANLLSLVFLVAVTALVLLSCSNSKEPVNVLLNETELPDISFNPPDENGRTTLGVWSVEIDPVHQTVSMEPVDRTADYHFQLTNLYPGVLQITDYGFLPSFWADIQLSHPFPGSGIDAFDPRVIAILPANPGVSFYYPTLNAHGNNRVVLYPDGYTNLFDRTDFAGTVNPFMAYFQTIPNRRWSSTEITTEAMRWDLDINGFGGPLRFVLVCDVSTNYPNSPTPITDNAREPVSVRATIGQGLNPDGGAAAVNVTLIDWQGMSGIGGVAVESPYLFSGIRMLNYMGPGPNLYEHIYSGEITNEFQSPMGDYPIAIATWDTVNGIYNMKEFTAHVGEPSLHLFDITPPWLNVTPVQVVMDRNYAFVASDFHGLHIYHIPELSNPHWIANIQPVYSTIDVAVKDGYAYILDNTGVLSIYNISEPDDPRLVTSVVTSEYSYAIDLMGDYAYIQATANLNVIDINPPQSAYIAKQIPLTSYNEASCMEITRGYAYLGTENSGTSQLKIFDIDPLAFAYEIGSVYLSSEPKDISLYNGYAYVATSYYAQVIDVDPPESPSFLSYLGPEMDIESIQVRDSYAYVTGTDYVTNESTLQVYDISIPGPGTLINELVSPGIIVDAYIGSSIGVIANQDSLVTLETTVPGNEYLWTTLHFIGEMDKIHFGNDYMYYAGDNRGVQVWDMDNPEMPEFMSFLYDGLFYGQIYEDNGYIYRTSGFGFSIFDIDPLESAYLVNVLNPPDRYRDVIAANGYAYVANENGGVLILDVDPPESASIIKTVDTPGTAYGVDYFNGYLYVADLNGGVQIIDVDPPSSAYIVKTIETGAAEEVKYQDGYLYVADYFWGFVVIDVDPPASAAVVKTVPVDGNAWAIDIVGDYALLGTGQDPGILHVLDINPLESSYVVDSMVTGWLAFDVEVRNNYAFVTDWKTGLKIIRLW